MSVTTFQMKTTSSAQLFSSIKLEPAYYFFWSLLALGVNVYYCQTNKEKIEDNQG